MARIFSVLAVVSVMLVLIAGSLGLWVGEYNQVYQDHLAVTEEVKRQYQPGEETNQRLQSKRAELMDAVSRANWHMLTGVLAGIVVVLVNSVSVTYFIGTSRWCKEVVDTYSLDTQLTEQCAALKRRSFPWAVVGMCLVMGLFALGGASDPVTGIDSTGKWVQAHFFAAMGSLAIWVFSFLRQADYIGQNSALVDSILEQVRKIRIERGLDVEAG